MTSFHPGPCLLVSKCQLGSQEENSNKDELPSPGLLFKAFFPSAGGHSNPALGGTPCLLDIEREIKARLSILDLESFS